MNGSARRPLMPVRVIQIMTYRGDNDISTMLMKKALKETQTLRAGCKPTNKQMHKHTNRQDRLQYTAPLSLARIVTRENVHSNKSWPIVGEKTTHILHKPHGRQFQACTTQFQKKCLKFSIE